MPRRLSGSIKSIFYTTRRDEGYDYTHPLERGNVDIHFFTTDMNWCIKTYAKGAGIAHLFEYFLNEEDSTRCLKGPDLQTKLNELNISHKKLVQGAWRHDKGKWWRKTNSATKDRDFFKLLKGDYDYVVVEKGREAWGASGGEIVVLNKDILYHDRDKSDSSVFPCRIFHVVGINAPKCVKSSVFDE